MWYRVFGTNDAQPQPAALLEHLHRLGLEVAGHFHGDDQGWFRAEVVATDEDEPIRVERFLSKDDDIRADLNTWAAWLETMAANPHHERLMQHVIGTTQLFTVERPADADETADHVCTEICKFLARITAGIYQADNQGFFAADGTLLVREE
jgi:hypothetical protein